MIEDIGQYYVYRHVRLDNNEVFYVGVGTKTSYKNITTKKETHREIYKRAYVQSIRNTFWKSIIKKTRYQVDILCESNDYDFIEEKEKEFIKLYGRRDLETGTLVNFTDGGKGLSNAKRKPLSEDTKKRMSESHKGKILSKEHKQNLSLAKQNNPPNYWKGKNFSEEHKEKLSKAHKNKPRVDLKGKKNIGVSNHFKKNFEVFMNGEVFCYYNITAKDLKKILNISNPTYTRWLNGKNKYETNKIVIHGKVL
jgi:hypothetical protein